MVERYVKLNPQSGKNKVKNLYSVNTDKDESITSNV